MLIRIIGVGIANWGRGIFLYEGGSYSLATIKVDSSVG
jgi:hypothetical protein